MNIERNEILKVLRKAPGQGLSMHDIAEQVGGDAKTRHRVRALLGELITDGSIEKAGAGRYRLPGTTGPTGDPAKASKTSGLVEGKLRVHPAGYGFLVRDDGEDDVFVPARYRGLALDGDRVALKTWPGYKGTEGSVEKVLERGRAKVTGVLKRDNRRYTIDPDDPRILATSGQVLVDGSPGAAKEGQAVVLEITRYPSRPDEPLMGRIVHILGTPGDPLTEIEKIIACGDIPNEFPRDVVEAGQRAPGTVSAEDLADRVDLRSRHFMTIDPETARDFDDAVCVEDSPKPGHTRLWVAVADVSHYVRPGSALDREARVRGCSVYLPDRAIPMLPEELSSGICSLNPEVDRLAMVARMEVAQDGAISDPYFCAAVIRSRARLDYAGVAAAVIAGDFRGARARYQEFLPLLQRMMEVSSRIRARRVERGSLDFDLPEAKVQLDADDPRLVRDVVQSRGDQEVKRAYQMIEDFMLAANEAVARHFTEKKMDAIWRVHDIPSEERLETFAKVAESLGTRFDAAKGKDPRGMRDFLATIKGRPMERALNFLALRALKQAQYDVVNAGHFALAAKDYVHFTSPIRRYPDLIIHRLLKISLAADGLPAGGQPMEPPSREDLRQRAQESSRHERRAMEAEREAVDLYRALLMRDRVGEEFDGTIAGVASFGLFVQIDAPFIEGLVKAETLGTEQFELDEVGLRLVGRRSGRAYALGDRVHVRIENVSVQRRKIDLALLSTEVERTEPLPARRPGGPGRKLPPAKGRPKFQLKTHGVKPSRDGERKRRKRR